MSNKTKIQLSQTEMSAMCNTEFFFTKHQVISKVFKLFGNISEELKNKLKDADFLPAEILDSSPRIFKGENYLQLPYVILDHPAVFGKQDIFAVRTMFWWGNFFSITLHVSGKYKNMLAAHRQLFSKKLIDRNFFICVNADQWQHHFKKENYLPASNLSQPEISEIFDQDFIKISKKIPPASWNDATENLLNYFGEILELLKASYLNGETDL